MYAAAQPMRERPASAPAGSFTSPGAESKRGTLRTPTMWGRSENVSSHRTLPPPQERPTSFDCPQDDKSRIAANPAYVETLDAYLERLAADAAVPGGGSAAALVASFGAALTAMVARIARRNPKNSSSTEALDTIVERSDALR